MAKPKPKPTNRRPKKDHSPVYKVLVATDAELRKLLRSLLT